MRNRRLLGVLSLACVVGALGGQVWAQQAPDMIVYNGKVVTVDDKSFTSKLGTIAQAMAIKDGKILAVGTTAQIRGQAGPNTKQMDLKGRTVLPGIIVVHDHPYDWAPQNPYSLKKVLTDDIVVTRYIRGSPQEQAKAFPGVLEEAVSKAKPGQWIFIVVSLGEKYEYGLDKSPGAPNVLDGKMIPKELLDRLAPNNPVLLRDPFTGWQLNAKGIEEEDKVFPQLDMVAYINHETGQGGDNGGAMSPMRWLFHEVVMKDHYPQLKEIHRLELGWWASLGVSTFGSRAYTPSNLKVFSDLSKHGQMPVRNMWSWGWREQFFDADPYLFNTIALLDGAGNDFFWNEGGWGVSVPASNCTTAQPRPGVEDKPWTKKCAYDPGSRDFQRLVAFVKSGARISNMHSGGDRDLDYLMEAIEMGSKEAGFTPEEIRSKRHTFDHLTLEPRPDQLPRLKRLGMVAGGNSFFFMENSPEVMRNFGEGAVEWVVPRKSMIDAGLPNGFEIDRPLATTSLTVFWAIARLMDRKSPQDGKVYAPDQRIGRELSLKTTTTWGAYYLMRENQTGSLESGKWADFIVLDRDYMTIPESDIENIRVLATVTGGKLMHLAPSIAREWGMQPLGSQVELGGPGTTW